MSFELYYTSAPEGIKRGSGGFCTVAASDGIPKALSDRLETLSAYRHHFSVNDAAAAASGGAAKNPVSYAHSILSVLGKAYHVLSRICDSGVDHTQRTNAFAHHMVVELAEREAATGGPAWLLKQAGVMQAAWDGNVGTLPSRSLPRGDGIGSKICNAWAAMTGDAGWGGHLADLFVKAPTRPVCILFEPGQELFPLMAESLALLPAAARWNVTFNTYFTSMPTSATCLWRCCVAGTPAAQSGERYAANGLILDLTSRGKLGNVPAGPLVTAARTGIGPTGPRPATTSKPRSVIVPAAKVETAKTEALDPEGDLEEEMLEKQRAALLELAPGESGEIPLADLPGEEQEAAEEPAVPEELARAAKEARTPPPSAAEKPLALPRKKPRAMAPAKKVESDVDGDASSARRRRQVMLLFGGALLTMAAGTGLVWMAARRNQLPDDAASPQKMPPPGNGSATLNPVKPAVEKPPVTVQENPAVDRTNKGTELPMERVDAQRPEERQPVRPITPTNVKPQEPAFADVVTLNAMIEKQSLTAMGDRNQGLGLKMGEIDRPAGVTGMRVGWPVGVNGTPGGADAATFKNDALGTLTTAGETRAGKPGVAVRFKGRGEASGAPGGEVIFIGFDKARPGIDLTWRTATLLKYSELFSFVYWTLQNSTLELQGPRMPGQRIAFKRVEMAPLPMAVESSAIPWPVDLPKETTVIPPKITQLPSGWEATWYTAWDEADATRRTTANALQVIKFKKPTASPVTDAWFLLTFRPGTGGASLAKVESTFTKRLESDLADKERYDGELRSIDNQIDEAKSHAIGRVLPDIESTRELMKKRESTAQLAAGFEQAVAAYKELKTFDVQFQNEGVTLATLRFQQEDKAGK